MKRVRITGTATLTFSKVIKVDDDFDCENDLHELPIYANDIVDHVESEDIEIDAATEVKK